MNMIRPSYAGWGRSLVKATALSAVLLINFNLNVHAQGLPPLPGDGGTQPPRELTPEELEAQRKAQEEVWRKNREAILPYLQSAPAAIPVDLVKQQRLISAELMERERQKAAVEQRKTDILNWADKVGKEQRDSKVRAEKLAKELGYKIRHESRDPSDVEVDMAGDELVFQTSYNVDAAKTISTDKARTNAPAGWGLNGFGIRLGLWDGGVIGTNHVEFTNGGFERVIWLDDTNQFDPTGHPTFMAGNMVAAGVDPLARGMASDAQVLAYNRDGDYSEMGTNSVVYGALLSNHSYGYRMGWDSGVWWGNSNAIEDWKFSAYTKESFDMDTLAYTNKNYLAVWAAGNGRSNSDQSGNNHYHWDEAGLKQDHHNANYTNYGGFGTLNYLATAKNGVTVGAVEDLTNGWLNATGVVMTSFSFWGPTDDGRIKPDIVSNGTGVYSATMTNSGTLTYATGSGTSAAAATVTGSLSLLTERFRQFGMEPTSATLRGLLVHTADDAGLAGPDYKFGFGLMNTDHAARLIMENAATYNPLSGGLLPDGHLLEVVLTNGTTQEFTVVQPIGSPLRATLAWTDPPGFYSGIQGQLNPTNRMLVNDLDMVLVNAFVATNYPYTLDPVSPYAPAHSNTNNRLDNVEQVDVATNTNGSIVYLTLRITHQGTLVDAGYLGSTTNQPYSLWVEGNLVYPKPVINGITQTGSNTVAVAWYATVGTDYKVQYIDEVDAPSNAWTDATGTVTAQYPLTAVEVAYSPSQPQRFYRIVLP